PTEVTLAALQPGRYDVRARAADAAGNDGVSATATLEIGGDPLARLARHFEANVGQADPQADLLARGRGDPLFPTPGGVVPSAQIEPTTIAPPPAPEGAPEGMPGMPGAEAPPPGMPEAPDAVWIESLRIGFDGALGWEAIGVNRLEARSNYFIGNDP